MAADILNKTIDSLIKKYGSGIVMDLRRDGSLPVVERVPVESPAIEALFGEGGVPRGRIIEIYGPPSGGKSSLCEYIAGQYQKYDFSVMDPETGDLVTDTHGEVKTRKGIVVYIDAEHSIDPEYARIHGFNMSDAILVQPDSGEQACDIAISCAESGAVDLVVIDSIAALTPQAEIDGDMDQQSMALQARMLSKFFRKATAIYQKTKTTMLCINQIRASMNAYGNPETTTGGNALKFYSSVRLELRRKEYMMDKDEVKGIIISAKSVKNKTSPPMVKVQLDMYYDTSFDAFREWIELAIELGVIDTKTSGAGYPILPSGLKLHGKGAVLEYYASEEHKDEYNELIACCKARKGKPHMELSEEN